MNDHVGVPIQTCKSKSRVNVACSKVKDPPRGGRAPPAIDSLGIAGINPLSALTGATGPQHLCLPPARVPPLALAPKIEPPPGDSVINNERGGFSWPDLVTSGSAELTPVPFLTFPSRGRRAAGLRAAGQVPPGLRPRRRPSRDRGGHGLLMTPHSCLHSWPLGPGGAAV